MKLIQPIILSCEQASAFIQKKEGNELGFVDSMRLKMHLTICAFCRQYAKQSEKLNEFIDEHFGKGKTSDNDDFKSQLKENLRDKMK